VLTRTEKAKIVDFPFLYRVKVLVNYKGVTVDKRTSCANSREAKHDVPVALGPQAKSLKKGGMAEGKRFNREVCHYLGIGSPTPNCLIEGLKLEGNS